MTNVKAIDPTIETFAAAPKAWLERQGAVSSPGKPGWLLAHCDNAVIWGRAENGVIALPAGVSLVSARIQEARLFGDLAEVRVWRAGAGFATCRIEDHVGAGPAGEWYDEEYWLWGTQGQPLANGFTQLSDGRQGLTHTVPLVIDKGSFNPERMRRPGRLTVRHYIVYDSITDQAQVGLSRLVKLFAV